MAKKQGLEIARTEYLYSTRFWETRGIRRFKIERVSESGRIYFIGTYHGHTLGRDAFTSVEAAQAVVKPLVAEKLVALKKKIARLEMIMNTLAKESKKCGA